MIWAVAAYVLAQVAIGWWAARRTSTAAEYYVAGRSLGPFAVTLSLFATWFGAETVMGSSAAVAEGGLSEARAEPFGYFVCLLLMGWLVAGRLREGGHLTLADFFRERFGRVAERLCVVANVPVSIVWAAAQFAALAYIVGELTDLPVQLTLGVSAAAVIVYTVFGGLRGDVVTDMVQGVILLVGLAFILGFMLARPGGTEALAAVDPARLSLIGEGESWLDRFDSWSIPILGSLVTSEAVARFLGARSARIARTGAFAAAGLYLVAGAAPLLIGLVAPGLGLTLGEGDLFLPSLAEQVLPPALLVVFVGALLSAILSTVDSNLLSVSALLTRNLVEQARPGMEGANRLWIARLVTVAAGLCAWAVAAAGESIYAMIEWTSAFGTSGVLVAFLIGAYAGFGRGSAAAAAILAGFACNLVTVIGPGLAGREELPGAFLLSVAVSLAAYLAAGALDRRRAAPAR